MGLVKFAGNNPFWPVESLAPHSQPSSWNIKHQVSMRSDPSNPFTDLLFRIVVLHNINDLPDLEGELIHILGLIFIGCFHFVEDTRWQVVSGGAWKQGDFLYFYLIKSDRLSQGKTNKRGETVTHRRGFDTYLDEYYHLVLTSSLHQSSCLLPRAHSPWWGCSHHIYLGPRSDHYLLEKCFYVSESF